MKVVAKAWRPSNGMPPPAHPEPAPHESTPLLQPPPAPLRKQIPGATALYPLHGIYYFLAHPFLYPLLAARLLPCFILSIVVLFFLFTFTYLPQVAFLAIFHGSLAWVNAVFLVLGEGAVIVGLLFECFFVDETLLNIFDAVLINEGMTYLVAPSRHLDLTAPNPSKQLGTLYRSSEYSPFSFIQILEFVILLPLNLVPYVGLPIFLVLTGARAGPLHHWRYFKLLHYRRKDRNKFIRERQWAYTWYGTAYLCLQLIPVAQMLFLLTSAAGSALWAVRLEKERKLKEEAERVQAAAVVVNVVAATPPV